MAFFLSLFFVPYQENLQSTSECRRHCLAFRVISFLVALLVPFLYLSSPQLPVGIAYADPEPAAETSGGESYVPVVPANNPILPTPAPPESFVQEPSLQRFVESGASPLRAREEAESARVLTREESQRRRFTILPGQGEIATAGEARVEPLRGEGFQAYRIQYELEEDEEESVAGLLVDWTRDPGGRGSADFSQIPGGRLILRLRGGERARGPVFFVLRDIHGNEETIRLERVVNSWRTYEIALRGLSSLDLQHIVKLSLLVRYAGVDIQDGTLDVALHIDGTGPQGTVTIRGGETYTNSRQVTLQLSASDSQSGVDAMSFSFDGTDFGPWIPFLRPFHTLELPEGPDGERSVYARYRDIWGNAGPAAVDAIILDRTAPLLEIDWGRTLSEVDTTSAVVYYREDGIEREAPFELPVEGPNELQLTAADAAGNQSVLNFVIQRDTVPPEIIIDETRTSHYVDRREITIFYTVDGIGQQETFADLQEGENLLTLSAQDRLGNASTATWQVFVDTVNDNPVIILPQDLSTREDEPLALTGLRVEDPDLPLQSLSVFFRVLSGILEVGSEWEHLVVAGNGTELLQILGTSAEVSSLLEGGGLVYSPSANFHGQDGLIVAVIDEKDGRARWERVITIESVEDEPVVSSIVLDLSDTDPNREGIQIEEDQVGIYSSEAGDGDRDPLAIRWIYQIGEGEETVGGEWIPAREAPDFVFSFPFVSEPTLFRLRLEVSDDAQTWVTQTHEVEIVPHPLAVPGGWDAHAILPDGNGAHLIFDPTQSSGTVFDRHGDPVGTYTLNHFAEQEGQADGYFVIELASQGDVRIFGLFSETGPFFLGLARQADLTAVDFSALMPALARLHDSGNSSSTDTALMADLLFVRRFTNPNSFNEDLSSEFARSIFRALTASLRVVSDFRSQIVFQGFFDALKLFAGSYYLEPGEISDALSVLEGFFTYPLFEIRALAHNAHAAFVSSPVVIETSKESMIQKAFYFFRDDEFFLGENPILSFAARYTNDIAEEFLRLTFPLDPDSQIRHWVIREWSSLLGISNFAANFVTAFSGSYRTSFENFRSIGLAAYDVLDMDEVIQALNLSTYREQIFRDFGIIVLNDFGTYSESDLQTFHSYLLSYPSSLIQNLGVFVGHERSFGCRGGAGSIGSGYYGYWGFTCGDWYARDYFHHEIGHVFLGMGNNVRGRPQLLPEKRWIRDVAFTGDLADAFSTYGNTGSTENEAEGNRLYFQNSISTLQRGIEKFRQGRPNYLRIFLSIMELFVRDGLVPLYSSNGLERQDVPVAVDEHKNITSLQLPDGTLYEFLNYTGLNTPDDLFFDKLRITNPDGTQEEYDNPLTSRPPVASDQSVTTLEDTVIQIPLTGVDPDGDSLTFSIVGAPRFGRLGPITVDSNGNVSVGYTPSENVSGTDTFTFKANDGVGDSNIAAATITITPVNDAPQARGDSAATNEDSFVRVNVLANDSDVEGDPLTVALVSGPRYGRVILNSDGTFTYLPQANFYGADSFTYKLNDGALDSNTATVSIRVNAVNDIPIAYNQSVSTRRETAVGIALSASDIEGDSLTFFITAGPQNGRIAGFDRNRGTLTYRPNTGFTGTDTFRFKVNDGSADSNIATVTIVVTAPTTPVAGTLRSAPLEQRTSQLNGLASSSDSESSRRCRGRGRDCRESRRTRSARR